MNKLEQNKFTAKYCANYLMLKNSGNEIERIGTTLFNSKIKLTPHQIRASLFAFKSPLNKGVILADEVGLGKTIEAGIVIAQTWFEKKDRILIVSPASLMRQWQGELEDKFGLRACILDRKIYNQKIKQGNKNPIKAISEDIIICSYQMCSAIKEDIRNINFAIVVIDEAHKLRNVHNEKNVISNNIKYALENCKKVLLTATPIQNNLMDLYGLCSILDQDIFGDKNIFKYNYIKNFEENKIDLESRLSNILHRTLRNQVQQYIQFTNRIPQTFSFELTSSEKEVYNSIRELLNNSDDDTYLIPKKQKHLLVLILCKLMGTSMHAIVYTLSKMLERLKKLRDKGVDDNLEFNEFYDSFDEEYEDIIEDDNVLKIDYNKLNSEIINLEKIIDTAKNVKDESKYFALKKALEYSFDHLKKLGAESKVLIFTESRKTQDYLYNKLLSDGYTDILLYNGENNSLESKKIYDEWIAKECNHEKISVNKSVNMKSAILDKFKNSGKILISTEAGAEGLNLQFCSLVINYDLPWNPQKVEQRIGRCHRFGQKFDVAVINFISADNVVEQRIYELLNNKFRLFSEVLGSSDSVIGTLEDGKDIEKAIIDIYSKCRTVSEINSAFDELQEKYKDDISLSLKKTKEELLNNFEEDIQKYFSDVMNSTEASISKIERILWKLLTALKTNQFEKYNENFVFKYLDKVYCLSSKNIDNEYIDFNMRTKLGSELLSEGLQVDLNKGHIKFDITNYPYNLTRVSKYIGKSGYISLNKVQIKSFENEEYLLFNGIFDNGDRIDADFCELLFRLNTEEYSEISDNKILLKNLEDDAKVNITSLVNQVEMKNNQYLHDEIKKINSWADDKIQAVQFDVETMRAQRKELQKQSDMASNMKEKQDLEEQILLISKKIKNSWMKLAIAEEDLENERKSMIDAIKKQNSNEFFSENLFTISFDII